MPNVLFDDALPTLVRILEEHGGPAFVEQGTILRDATGRLTFFCRQPRAEAMASAGSVAAGHQANEAASGELAPDPLAKRIAEALGPYARAQRPVVYADEGSAPIMLDSRERIPVRVGDVFCHLIDRRIVGAGWVAQPALGLARPPRLVFASLKGGVGRSTALTAGSGPLCSAGAGFS